MSSLLFNPEGFGQQDEHVGIEGKQFGERYRGRYHMPLLPGEAGTKSGGNWVPYGLMSATNLAGAIVDSRALSIWERERSQIGLALRPDLFEKMSHSVNLAAHHLKNNFDGLKDTEDGQKLVKALTFIHDESKTAAGADRAAQMGTNRHDVWEGRAKSGLLFGTPSINAEILALEALLEENGLERVPGMQERVVRNLPLQSAGRLDDVLRSRKTGRLYLADLKTKKKAFYSWLEAWIQQAVYAGAEWMLDESKQQYVPGPLHHVDQDAAILLRMPSDGAAPYLQRVDLECGRRWAHIAHLAVNTRSEARSTETNAKAVWREEVTRTTPPSLTANLETTSVVLEASEESSS